MIETFEFQRPWVLAFLALLPIYAFLRGRSGREGALEFSSAELVASLGGRVRAAAGRLFIFLRVISVGLVIIALAGPRRINERTETLSNGVDVMLVYDLSWSMMALDMAPPGTEITRFNVAQERIRDFIVRRPSDRIGLIVFSGVPYLVSPTTMNHDWLLEQFDRLHIGIVREVGTAIGDACGMAVKNLSFHKESRGRVIVLLTDGDNNKWETFEPMQSAMFARDEKVRIYTIGIGKDEACPLYDFDRETGKFYYGPGGTHTGIITMLSPANYKVLDDMAKKTGGKSYTATNKQELESVYDDINRLEKTERKIKQLRTYTPLFQIPLLAALALLAIELLLANTRFRRVP
jgi:Ca-activated chloride channel family protein